MNDRAAAWNFLLAMLFRDSAEPAASPERVAHSRRFWEETLSIANTSLVTAPLWTAIEKRGLADAILPDARDYLEGFHVINGERNAAILNQLAECCALLTTKGIAVMPFKGVGFLVDALYDDSGDRFLTDLDLIVPANRALEAWRVLRNSGYVLARPDTGCEYSAAHQLEPLVKSGSPAELEMHIAAVPRALERHLPIDELWARARRRITAFGELRLPSAVDAVVTSVVHTELIDQHASRLLLPLRAYLDLHHLLKKSREEIDDGLVEARLATSRARHALQQMVATLRAFTGNKDFPLIEISYRARVHSALCRETAVRPVLARAALRYWRLTDRGLRERFDVVDANASLASYRLQVVGEMLGQGFGKLLRQNR